MAIVYVDGRKLNTRTAKMLRRAEQRLGYNLTVIQGSYNAGGVRASAGTHDGGGAIDISVRSLKNPREVVKQLRLVGFAAWYRHASQGPWSDHIHAIAIGDSDLSSGAASQVREYYAGYNGLVGNARDDGPRFNPIPTFKALPIISVGRLKYQFSTKKPKNVQAVRRVQQLLNYRRNAGLKVDGIAGPKTREAYRKWERHVRAPYADGVPGMFSVARLVAGYYKPVL